jgi:hypothetical protein
VGLGNEKHFHHDHRVLNRAGWSSRAASQVLLGLLVRAFAPSGPLLVGLDDTIERRWGKQIAARGIYRDPVRSSRSHLVKASGLRWLSLMSWSRFPGPDGSGLCPFSPCWLFRSVITRNGNSATRLWSIGAARCDCNFGAGCRSVRWCWLSIAATRRWSFWGAWPIGSSRSPASPACVWMPNSMLRCYRDGKDKSAGPGAKGHACRVCNSA